MKIRRSKHFKKSYQKLSPVLQKRVDKALMLLAMNVRHPSLRVKKIQGTDDIYELRVTRPIALASRAIGAIGSALRSRTMAISCVGWGNTMICCVVLEKCNRGTLAMYSQETTAITSAGSVQGSGASSSTPFGCAQGKPGRPLRRRRVNPTRWKRHCRAKKRKSQRNARVRCLPVTPSPPLPLSGKALV